MEISFELKEEWLRVKGPSQRAFHERAAQSAWAHFGKRVFVRGVVEISNYCRENCGYCGMRRDNAGLQRHRAQWEQLAALILQCRPPSVTDVNIQAGEDPIAVMEIALPLIRALRKETNLGVSVCLGTLNPTLYQELRQAGASIYIIKFEMADPQLYDRLQAPGTLRERVAHIRLLAAQGWRVSSGFIAGLPGQTLDHAMESLALASELPLDGCSVSPFISGEETPMRAHPGGDIDLTLNCMAALRLIRPGWVIPAVSALNLAEPGAGYGRGLATGANLVTINMTPPAMREDYLLYKRDRFIMTEDRILTAIDKAGLAASAQSLADWYRTQPSRAIDKPSEDAIDEVALRS